MEKVRSVLPFSRARQHSGVDLGEGGRAQIPLKAHNTDDDGLPPNLE